MRKLTRATPLPVALLVASFLCPTELSVYLGSIRLPPHRFLLLILLPVALWHAIAKRRISITAFDILFLAFASWSFGAYINHHGSSDGLQTGGAIAIDSFASYLVARVFIRDEIAYRATLSALLIAVSLVALIALPEAVFGSHFVHDILHGITGYAHPTGEEVRIGLMRAYGTFDHPIHLGSFCAAILAMVWFSTSDRWARYKNVALISGATFLAVSSAPLLCLALQLCLVFWNFVTKGLKGRLVGSLIALVAAYGVAALIFNRSPLAFIATGMTLDPWTGFYRLMIWEHGIDNVWANMWTGIGLNDWIRPWWMVSATVDAFWLVIAMRTGIPSLIFLAIGIVVLAALVNRRSQRGTPENRSLALGWTMSLISLSLLGCTVHFWNVLMAYFFFFLGLGSWMADPVRAMRATKTQARRDGQHAKASLAPWPTQIVGGLGGAVIGPGEYYRPIVPLNAGFKP